MCCLVMAACGNIKLFRATYKKDNLYLVMLNQVRKFATVFLFSQISEPKYVFYNLIN